MSPKGSVLIIDDEQEIRESILELLRMEGYSADAAPTAEEGLKKVEGGVFDLVLLDINLPDRNGLELLKVIKHEAPEVGVIMITAYDSSQMAFQASREGAESYITKPWDNDKLLLEVRNLLDKSRLQAENLQLRRALKRFSLPNLVGKSDKMQKVMDLITQVAVSRATVLINGESGTGKELVAKTIHAMSPRADHSFVPVNTGSMPVDLLESTLFGHVKGAFTSAIATKRGLFEVADQGTIFFDEIGTVGVETQAKLLRVIQEREFMRLGGTETIKVDVRILAATNADLRKLVVTGHFREDLYYRLNVINICLPPLRDRKEDIPHLVEHFLRKFEEENGRNGLQFSPAAMKAMMDYDWPGNVRELENAVERAVVLASGPTLGPDILPEQLFQNGSQGAMGGASEDLSGRSLFEIMEAKERTVILEMLARTNWSQTDAAERFKIPLSTLNQKIKRLQIDVKRRGEA
ncbi:fused response regulator of ato opeon, in two-component system with AtoS: response regulator; sigma54 interaction protein [Acidobacteriia bacterium SbA2]|nr:fused response regulator of ato opeon, in two-component system with AtoS: response regulator; sigma54 interaction protein [Acidobacteriia bacterium SbA2]